MDQHGKYRPLVRGLLFALWAGLAALPLQAAQCRLALVLALDVSSSVDEAEYVLQRDGLAAALGDPDIRAAILRGGNGYVALAVYEWSGPQFQRLVVDWVAITDEAALAAVTTRLRSTTRLPSNPTTALGTAMLYGGRLLQDRRNCWRRTLDISGDGRTNTGPRPRDVDRDPILADITINALVIGSDHPDGGVPAEEIKALRAHFEHQVIRGPGAFTEVALGFADYERAMVRKLLRETEGLAIGQLAPAR